MICYKMDLSRLIRVILLGKEVLSKERVHYTRYVSEYLLYVVTRGRLELIVNDERVTISEGECYLFKRGDYQEPINPTDCEYYYVHFIADERQIEELDEDESLVLSDVPPEIMKELQAVGATALLEIEKKRG